MEKKGGSNLQKDINRVWLKLVEHVLIISIKGVDSIKWNFIRDRHFTIKSACDLPINGLGENRVGFWQSCETIHKRSNFPLIIGPSTNANRKARHMMDCDKCQRCDRRVETSLYATCNYPAIFDIWLRLVEPKFWSQIFNCFLDNWCKLNFY